MKMNADDKFDHDLTFKNLVKILFFSLCEFCPKWHPVSAAPNSGVLKYSFPAGNYEPSNLRGTNHI